MKALNFIHTIKLILQYFFVVNALADTSKTIPLCYTALIAVDKFPKIEVRRVIFIRLDTVVINKVNYRGCSKRKRVCWQYK